MNVITDTLGQLVRRKLWPVALVLLGALVAVPLVLAKQPEADPIAQAANAKKVEPLPATFVSAAGTETTESAQRRRVLGAMKDPFEPAALPKAKKAKKAKKSATADATPTATPAGDAKEPAGTGTGGAATPPVSPAPTATPEPKVTVPAFSVKVRFGTTDSEELPESTIERLSVLPDETNPIVIYRGVADGGKVAIFELTGDVKAEGDATCAPTPEDCQYIKLRAGETEFLTISDADEATPDAQFELDLVKIYKKATKEKAPAATATQSLAKASSSSLKGKSKGFPLRRRNRYVFDAETGTLHRAAEGAKTPLSDL